MKKPKKWRMLCKKRQKTGKRILTAPKAAVEIRRMVKTSPEEKMVEGV